MHPLYRSEHWKGGRHKLDILSFVITGAYGMNFLRSFLKFDQVFKRLTLKADRLCMVISKIYLRITILFLIIFSFPIWGIASPLTLTDDKSFYELGLHLDILEDKTSKMTVDEVKKSKLFKKK